MLQENQTSYNKPTSFKSFANVFYIKTKKNITWLNNKDTPNKHLKPASAQTGKPARGVSFPLQYKSNMKNILRNVLWYF